MKMDKNSAEFKKRLSTIKKLLALGTSPHEGEANSAMEKAGVLMAKWNIHLAETMTETEIKLGVEEIKVKGYGDFNRRSGKTGWQVFLACGIAECFDCETINSPNWDNSFDIHFIGMSVDAITTKWFYMYIRRWIQSKADEIRPGVATMGATKARDSFCAGAKDEVLVRLHKMYQAKKEEEQKHSSCSALIILKDDAIADFKKANYPNLQSASYKSTASDREAYSKGRVEGENIPLHRQVA